MRGCPVPGCQWTGEDLEKHGREVMATFVGPNPHSEFAGPENQQEPQQISGGTIRSNQAASTVVEDLGRTQSGPFNPTNHIIQEPQQIAGQPNPPIPAPENPVAYKGEPNRLRDNAKDFEEFEAPGTK